MTAPAPRPILCRAFLAHDPDGDGHCRDCGASVGPDEPRPDDAHWQRILTLAEVRRRHER